MAEYIDLDTPLEVYVERGGFCKKANNICRNELCLRCGGYEERHNGACDGCRWKERGNG